MLQFPRTGRSWLAAALTLLVSAGAGWASSPTEDGHQPLPNGWGGIQFRMTVAEAQALHPSMELQGDTGDMLRDGVVTVPRLQEYRLEDQAGLGRDGGCEVILKFAADQLYFVDVRCADLADAGPYLLETYGEPTRFFIDADYWYSEERVVSHRRGSYSVGFIDHTLDQLVQTSIKQEMVRQMGKELQERGITSSKQLSDEILKEIHPEGKAQAEAERKAQAEAAQQATE